MKNSWLSHFPAEDKQPVQNVYGLVLLKELVYKFPKYADESLLQNL